MIRQLLVDPATLEELGSVPDMGITETTEAINAATKAFATWSKTTAKVGSDRPHALHEVY
jgi:succinate-semialdehyde dehydrogenase/glutarate-semialdehyde dehydrogenase